MIIPALLTTNPRIAEERINLAKQMSGWLHIDVLDNTLYPFTSLALEELKKLDFGDLQLEIHCMTENPLAVVESGRSIDRIILHYELAGWEDHYRNLSNQSMDTWIAIAPESEMDSLSLPDDVPGVVIMGVEPGQGGQMFLEDTFDRLDTFLRYYPDTPITIDGGVTEDNIRTLLAYGIDNFIVGNALFRERDPLAMYRRFERLSDPIGGQL